MKNSGRNHAFCSKVIKKTALVLLTAAVLLGTGVTLPAAQAEKAHGFGLQPVIVQAQESTQIGPWDPIEKGEAATGDGAYTYTVNVYAGKEGYFSSTGSEVKSYTVNAGDPVAINIADLVVKDPDQYYARGMKIAGHDNDEISTRDYRSYAWAALDADYNFSVAYGITGGMVKYVVYYVDENGNNLLDPETFYGMAGDKPVVSYQYVSGYRPNAWNQGKTLLEDESRNVITFTYARLAQPTAAAAPAATGGTGTTGITGTTGTTGAAGTGTEGTAGTGAAGTAGATDTAGTAGISGTGTEAAGVAGNAGNAGTAGVTGAAGTAGTAETSGTGTGGTGTGRTDATGNAGTAGIGATDGATGTAGTETAPVDIGSRKHADLDDPEILLAGVSNHKPEDQNATEYADKDAEKDTEKDKEKDGDKDADMEAESNHTGMSPVLWVCMIAAAAVVVGCILWYLRKKQ